ncbi:MAG TPA: hypothetical protein VGP22_04395, partial [Albitalea sp.]|nr:hypothetical protein [Albitalea sp.]
MTPSNRSPWPQTAASSNETDAGADLWGLGAALETQARLWNHLLDANRNFWDLYAPWMQGSPWLLGAATAKLERDEEGEQPA